MSVEDKNDSKVSDQGTETVILRKKGVPDSIIVYLWCMAGAALLMGWKKFFVGIGVDTSGTIAETMGAALLPFLLGYVIAKGLSFKLKKLPFKNLWLISATVVIVMGLIGQWRIATGL